MLQAHAMGSRFREQYSEEQDGLYDLSIHTQISNSIIRHITALPYTHLGHQSVPFHSIPSHPNQTQQSNFSVSASDASPAQNQKPMQHACHPSQIQKTLDINKEDAMVPG